jgi:WD40 repeat protein
VPPESVLFDWHLAQTSDQLPKRAAHSRIIWSCSWAPSSRWFATVSRDKSLRIWRLEKNDENDGATKVSLAQTQVADQPLTAVDFAPAFRWGEGESRFIIIHNFRINY